MSLIGKIERVKLFKSLKKDTDGNESACMLGKAYLKYNPKFSTKANTDHHFSYAVLSPISGHQRFSFGGTCCRWWSGDKNIMHRNIGVYLTVISSYVIRYIIKATEK